MSTACRRYLISGRVQGVFFRDSTRTQARQAGITGWVRNLQDGRVEALLCGAAPALDEMEIWLRSGPELAKVTRITRIDTEETPIPADFEILPTASVG